VSFDALAPHYRWLETVTFGRKLQAARTALLAEIERPRRVLLLGEGNGRFLVELIRAHPDAEITCVDASARMIEVARRCVYRAMGRNAQVRFVHSSAEEFRGAEGTYDLIVTNFFLDCFGADELNALVKKIAGLASPQSAWLVAEFQLPNRGTRRVAARLIVGFMYLFFRATTGITATRLVGYQSLFAAERFVRCAHMEFAAGMVCSELWQRKGST
jgi:ubiquinone/menaquinone biosynthesis C-methylase UbiE